MLLRLSSCGLRECSIAAKSAGSLSNDALLTGLSVDSPNPPSSPSFVLPLTNVAFLDAFCKHGNGRFVIVAAHDAIPQRMDRFGSYRWVFPMWRRTAEKLLREKRLQNILLHVIIDSTGRKTGNYYYACTIILLYSMSTVRAYISPHILQLQLSIVSMI